MVDFSSVSLLGTLYMHKLKYPTYKKQKRFLVKIVYPSITMFLKKKSNQTHVAQLKGHVHTWIQSFGQPLLENETTGVRAYLHRDVCLLIDCMRQSFVLKRDILRFVNFIPWIQLCLGTQFFQKINLIGSYRWHILIKASVFTIELFLIIFWQRFV